MRVGASGTVKKHYSDPKLQGIPVTKNGYIFVYVSNESNLNVFFDNLQVIHKPGPIVEETHYYPFGLTMAGISSKAMGKLENKFKFNGGNELQNKEFTDGSGLDWYDATFRGYDPQIGRFMQVDPLADILENLSPYSFANNNPLLFSDPLGLAADTAWKTLPEVVVVGHKPNTPPSAGFIDFDGGRTLPGSNSEARVSPLPVEPLPIEAPKVDIRSFSTPSVNPWVLRSIGTVGLTLSPLTAGSGSDRRLYDQFQRINTRIPSPVQEPEGIQYTLRARADGFYPVYAWGSMGTAISGIWLKKGEIWKIGTTINGINRYSQEYYRSIGKGLDFAQEYPLFGKAPMDQVLYVEKMKLINYVMSNNGNLPPGNTKFQ